MRRATVNFLVPEVSAGKCPSVIQQQAVDQLRLPPGVSARRKGLRPRLFALQFLNLTDLQRTAEQVALAVVHAYLTQEAQLPFVLDAFGDDRLAELVGHRAYRLHDHAAAFLVHAGPRQSAASAGHEILRNLEAGYGQSLKVRK